MSCSHKATLTARIVDLCHGQSLDRNLEDYDSSSFRETVQQEQSHRGERSLEHAR